MHKFNLPNFKIEVWILAFGRLLSQVGSGFTLFYAPIFFVEEIGLSATQVGIALGSESISGVLGRFCGGYFADYPQVGRKKILLISALISALASIVLAFTNNFTSLILGNLLMGLGIGLYWPATEATIADLTTDEQRNEAFAITRLADSLGLAIGVILGAVLIANAGNYRALFIIDAFSFLVFFLIIFFAIIESDRAYFINTLYFKNSWKIAFTDRALMFYVLVNVLFTTYLSQIQSTLPLYLKNFLISGGFSPRIISSIFTWYIVFAVICQLPIVRLLNRFNRFDVLIISLLFWGVGFSLIWLVGVVNNYALIWAIIALAILAIAMDTYTPAASALVVDLAPNNLRAIYLSINSQCWAIGYFFGPPLGGLALDTSPNFARFFWLIMSMSIVFGIIILHYLKRNISCLSIRKSTIEFQENPK